MSRLSFDPADAAFSVVFTLAAASTVGIADVTLFSYSLSDTATAIQGTGISWALILSAAAFGATWVSNDNADLDAVTSLRETSDDYDTYYWAASIATPALLVGFAFVPQLHEFAASSDWYALGIVAVQTTGQVVIGWML